MTCKLEKVGVAAPVSTATNERTPYANITKIILTGLRVLESLGRENALSSMKGSIETGHTFISALLRTFT